MKHWRLLLGLTLCAVMAFGGLASCGDGNGSNGNGGGDGTLEGLWRMVAGYEQGSRQTTYPATCTKDTQTYTTDRYVYFVNGIYRVYTNILNYADFGLPQGIFTCPAGNDSHNGTFTLNENTLVVINSYGTHTAIVNITGNSMVWNDDGDDDYVVFEKIDLSNVNNAQDDCDRYDKWCD